MECPPSRRLLEPTRATAVALCSLQTAGDPRHRQRGKRLDGVGTGTGAHGGWPYASLPVRTGDQKKSSVPVTGEGPYTLPRLSHGEHTQKLAWRRSVVAGGVRQHVSQRASHIRTRRRLAMPSARAARVEFDHVSNESSWKSPPSGPKPAKRLAVGSSSSPPPASARAKPSSSLAPTAADAVDGEATAPCAVGILAS